MSRYGGLVIILGWRQPQVSYSLFIFLSCLSFSFVDRIVLYIMFEDTRWIGRMAGSWSLSQSIVMLWELVTYVSPHFIGLFIQVDVDQIDVSQL